MISIAFTVIASDSLSFHADTVGLALCSSRVRRSKRHNGNEEQRPVGRSLGSILGPTVDLQSI